MVSQHRHESLFSVFSILPPSIAIFRLLMPNQKEYFHVTFPDGSTINHFMHGNSLLVNNITLVFKPDCILQQT